MQNEDFNDKHLNLFYSYNHDNELIENNITRALILLIDLVSEEMKNAILSKILNRSRNSKSNGFDFSKAKVALQDQINPEITLESTNKIMLTISSFPDISKEGENQASSKPDAWFWDPRESYCILIEIKIGNNPLDYKQLKRHARKWFDIRNQDYDEWSRTNVISISWNELLSILMDVEIIQKSPINEFDTKIMNHFVEFLSFFGYRFFKDFNFGNLFLSNFKLLGSTSYRSLSFGHVDSEEILLNLSKIPMIPQFSLKSKIQSDRDE